MKSYKVTVNGNTYDVGVEEIGGTATVRSVHAAPAPRSAPPPPRPATAPAPRPAPVAAAPAPVAAPAPAPEAAPAAAPAVSGPTEDVLSPLPGTVLSVNVQEGDAVIAGQVLLIFEAMKMENEIVTHRDGTVAKVYVAKGDALESGKPVIALA